MDVHGFTNIHVVSPADLTSSTALPEILAAAKRGEYDEDALALPGGEEIHDQVEALFNGTVQVPDPQGKAYGLLLLAECRYWHGVMPFMFEGAGDSARSYQADELLMPPDLLATGSVLRNAVVAMTPEDCGANVDGGFASGDSGNVEIIGWLYQFYISERKDEVMAGFKKNHKASSEEIPAATQLFTPDWIVRYLVQNTVGKLWTQSHPESQLHKSWEYYIEPDAGDTAQAEADDDHLVITTPQELTVCDPACGSGHMLTYAFDLLYQFYLEQGYTPSEIPGLILENNLYGMEIDERAASLAQFALMMKARAHDRRYFSHVVFPHICVVEPVEFNGTEVDMLNDAYGVDFDDETWNTYRHADVAGSLIQPSDELVNLSKTITDDALQGDPILDDRAAKGLTPVELRLDAAAAQIIDGTPASDKDFDTEYLDYILAVGVVDSLDAAIAHVLAHSTHHSDAIVTEDAASAERFINGTDSAATYVNVSTRFTDGGEFGLGCEMGISTQKLHARGPMGLRELTTYKYIIRGNGQIR